MNTRPLQLSVADVIARLEGRVRLDAAPSKPGMELTVYPLRSGALDVFAIHAPLQALHSLCSTACVASPSCFPVSAFAHMFDTEAFSELPAPAAMSESSFETARIGAFLSIGELFVYLNEDRPAPPSAYAAQYTRTLAYAMTRARLLWPLLDRTMIYRRWMESRSSTGWSSNEALLPARLCANLDYWIGGAQDLFPWGKRLLSEAGIADADFASRAGILVSNTFGLALPPLPSSFDGRFEWLTVAATRLRASTSSVEDVEFALGLLLASIEPGELMHLNWLRSHLVQYPHAAVHYAGWSATLSAQKRDRTDVFSGLGRRLMRDLLRPFRLEDAPLEDLSWLDIRASGDLLDDTRIRASGRSLTISLVPGVVVGGALHKSSEQATRAPTKETKTQRAPSRPATALATQPALFDIAASPHGELFASRVTREIQELRRKVEALQADVARPSTSKAKRK